MSTTNPVELQIRRPDDWHLHLRDGDVLADTTSQTANVFGRALIMPNLRPPVRTAADALAYRERIASALASRSGSVHFEPLMALYLTPETTPADVETAAATPGVVAIKLYPAGATTNAQAGISDLHAQAEVFAAMQEHDLVLCIHGESIAPGVDVFDREAEFVRRDLSRLVQDFPRLRIVLEHVSSRVAVQFVQEAPETVAATITIHHLLLDRNAMFAGGLRPHHYCLPVLKRREDKEALLAAALSGNPKFFLGTDSAPHPRDGKESACGCAGVFSAPVALPLCAELFEREGALVGLEAFVSEFGARFYRVPTSEERVTLRRESWVVPEAYPLGAGTVVPLWAGQEIAWRVVGA